MIFIIEIKLEELYIKHNRGILRNGIFIKTDQEEAIDEGCIDTDKTK